MYCIVISLGTEYLPSIVTMQNNQMQIHLAQMYPLCMTVLLLVPHILVCFYPYLKSIFRHFVDRVWKFILKMFYVLILPCLPLHSQNSVILQHHQTLQYNRQLDPDDLFLYGLLVRHMACNNP